eukprot:s1078_g15.t1
MFHFLTTGPLGPQVPKCTDPVCDGCVPWTAIHPLDDLEEHWPHCFYNELRVSLTDRLMSLTEIPANPKANGGQMTEVMPETLSVSDTYMPNQEDLSLPLLGPSFGFFLNCSNGDSYEVSKYDDFALHHTGLRADLTGCELARSSLSVLKGIFSASTMSFPIAGNTGDEKHVCEVLTDARPIQGYALAPSEVLTDARPIRGSTLAMCEELIDAKDGAAFFFGLATGFFKFLRMALYDRGSIFPFWYSFFGSVGDKLNVFGSHLALTARRDFGKVFLFRLFAQAISVQKTQAKSWVTVAATPQTKVYFQRVSRQADKTPMAWRKGGGASLGIRISHDSKDEGLTNCWKVRGVPREWTDKDFASALIGAGWTEVSVKTIPQFRKQPWFIRARGPGKLGEEVAAVQVGTDLLTLERAQAHTRKVPTLAFLKPKARPSSTTFGERRGTSVQARAPADTAAETADANRERSPRRGTGGAAPAPVAAAPQWPDPGSFEELDCGGLGQCGFNAVAAGFALNEGMAWSEVKRKMVTRGKTLRQQAHQYITEHEDDFKNVWCVDETWTEQTEGGTVATHWKEWLEQVTRPKRWICQYTVRALASRLGAKIVIVRGGGGRAWERPIAVGTPEHLAEPIVVSLREHHYRVIRAAPGYQMSGLKRFPVAIQVLRLAAAHLPPRLIGFLRALLSVVPGPLRSSLLRGLPLSFLMTGFPHALPSVVALGLLRSSLRPPPSCRGPRPGPLLPPLLMPRLRRALPAGSPLGPLPVRVSVLGCLGRSVLPLLPPRTSARIGTRTRMKKDYALFNGLAMCVKV